MKVHGLTDNTSALLSQQKASETVLQDVIRRINCCVEDLAWIWYEFIANYYGKRKVEAMPTEDMKKLYEFSGAECPSTVTVDFNFAELKKYSLMLDIEAGGSSFFSEVSQMSTLDNLVINKLIDADQYVERVPAGLIPMRDKLVAELRAKQQATLNQEALMQQAEMGQLAPDVHSDQQALSRSGSNKLPDNMTIQPKTFNAGGGGRGGYSELARQINGQGQIPPMESIKFQDGRTK